MRKGGPQWAWARTHPHLPSPRRVQRLQVEALQPEPQHRPVGLAEDVLPHLDDQVRPNAQDVAVE